jgi:putative transposase
LGAIWKRELDQGVIAVSDLGALVCTAQSRESIQQVRIVPKGDHYVIEVVYQDEPKPARVDPALFVAADLGLNVLTALTSNKPGFLPRLVTGRPVKSINQFYNKQRARHQKRLARANRYTSRQLDRITTKRNRRIVQYLHTASRRIIELLVAEGIGTLIIGKNPRLQTRGRDGQAQQSSVCGNPTRPLDRDAHRTSAELVGIRVVITEESYTSQASFLDRDPLPVYDPAGIDAPRFSGRRDGRWYRASSKRIIHADVNGSYDIGRKVVPTAFDGLGIVAPAVVPRRLAV